MISSPAFFPALSIVKLHTPVTTRPMPASMTILKIASTPDDYGRVPVAGELLRLTMDDIAIRRNDPRAGDVVVHFPRVGYRVDAAA